MNTVTYMYYTTCMVKLKDHFNKAYVQTLTVWMACTVLTITNRQFHFGWKNYPAATSISSNVRCSTCATFAYARFSSRHRTQETHKEIEKEESFVIEKFRNENFFMITFFFFFILCLIFLLYWQTLLLYVWAGMWAMAHYIRKH